MQNKQHIILCSCSLFTVYSKNILKKYTIFTFSKNKYHKMLCGLKYYLYLCDMQDASRQYACSTI